MEQSRLYVGNINYRASEHELSELFGQYGNLKSIHLIEKDGLKKGFGFVEFDSNEGAAAAKNDLDGKEFMSRELRVDFAKPKKL